MGLRYGMRVEITDEVIASAEIAAEIKAAADGAVCVFDGIVRDNTRGRKTLYLDYEAYREMALEKMRGLAGEAVELFGVRDVALVHRLGRLYVGETSVLIVVASAHRGAAFEACRWLIDTLKKTVPIWKKEQFVDGAVWADGEPFPEEQRVGGLASQPVSETEGASEALVLGGADGLGEESGSRLPARIPHPIAMKPRKDGAPGGLASQGVSETAGPGGHASSDDADISEAMYRAPGSVAKVEGGGAR
ncbi:molybdenum cofactor biosynthesis protein MoaE [Tunturibacter empetritectus]|uniref:Molybdopterin synthase catalytic subunit n=1 Tax=Tunturiibacter empetritectus TaxID=3069691 RepID=A0AAU7ZE84_9BACT